MKRRQIGARRRASVVDSLEGRLLLSAGLISDVNATPISSTAITSAVNVNGTGYFVADDAVHGAELWKTDGTSGGTVLVKDINPGKAASAPAFLTAFNNKLYFAATDGLNGVALWKTDGTAAGTQMVSPGSAGKSPHGLIALGSQLLFFANDQGGTAGEGLWQTDGSTITKVKPLR